MKRGLCLAGVVLTFALVPAQAEAVTKTYWIAAVPTTWNVIPSGRDPISGTTFPPEQTTLQTVVYKRFTRGWGRVMGNGPAIGDNDGIPGPTIRARVGDTVIVRFKNMDTLRNAPHSMHFHGFRYEFASDGAFIPGMSTAAANVPPGRTATYRLRAVRNSRGVFPYHDHSQSMAESMMGGMIGAMSILGRRERRADRENVVFFHEMLGFHTINGRAYVGNTPTFRAKTGQLVQWEVLALGEFHHTFHIHGHRWKSGHEFIDTRTLGPGESFRVRFREDVRGPWLYHCHVESHIAGGMQGLYRVTQGPRRRSGVSGSLAGRGL